ncbi:MAG TPA: histidine phosphatase family protein, partial [Methylocystis sp.]
RPLTRRGMDDARRMGEFLRDADVAPDLAVASNARRAKQTLDQVLEVFPGHVTHLIENTIYLATVDHLVEILRQTPDRVATLLAVGHNPGFAELACWLAGSGEADEMALMRTKFPTAALAMLDFDTDHWSDVRRGGARLARFVTPGILRGEETEDPD